MRRRRPAALSGLALSGALVACGALAGCGASTAPAPRSGRALFAETCSACHSLSGVESPKRQGGDLLGVHLSPAVTLQFTRVMPVRRHLSQAEVKAVTDYVLAVEHGALFNGLRETGRPRRR